MKKIIKEYIHIFAIFIIGLMFGLGFYYILLNSYHSTEITDKAYISKTDIYYQELSDNLEQIKENIDKYSYYNTKFNYSYNDMEKIFSSINYCYDKLNTKESVISVKEDDYINYSKVYDYNNYFINTIIDKCFTTNFAWIDGKEIKDSKIKKLVNTHKLSIKVLTNNALYLKNELQNNSSYYYNNGVSNTVIRNNLNSSYRMVLSNYDYFSQMLLDLSNYLVSGDKND